MTTTSRRLPHLALCALLPLAACVDETATEPAPLDTTGADTDASGGSSAASESTAGATTTTSGSTTTTSATTLDPTAGTDPTATGGGSSTSGASSSGSGGGSGGGTQGLTSGPDSASSTGGSDGSTTTGSSDGSTSGVDTSASDVTGIDTSASDVTGIDTSASDVTGIDTSASDTDSGGIDTSATATDTDGSSATTDSGGIDTSATASATDTDGSSGTTDASTTDASTTDASTTDASTTDASTTDASTTDASTTDASTTGGGGPTPAPFVANGTFETADGWTLGGDFAVATSSAGSTTPGALQLSGDFFAYGDASTTYDGSVIEDGVSVAFACRISSSGLAFLSPRLDGVGVSSASGLNCEDQWQVYELCTAELSHGASGTFGFDGLLDFAQPGDVAEIDDITLIPAIDCPPWGEIAYGDVDSGLWFTGDGRTGGVMEASGDRALMLKRTGNTFDPASVVTARTNAAVPTGYAGLALRWAMHGDMPAGSGRYYVQLSGAGASSTYDLEGPFSEATDVDVTLCLDPALEGQAGVITLSWQSYGISDAAHEVYLDDFTFVDEPGCIP